MTAATGRGPAAGDTGPRYAVVIPTLGRPSLSDCLHALAAGTAGGGPGPREIVLVDDRPPHDCTPLDADVPDAFQGLVTVVPGCAAGPAAARNTGWRAVREPWIVFLDDDVLPGPGWAADLAADLAAADSATAGIQARVTVPLPRDRKPTDWERNTAGLATSQWITADMAYRRSALEALGGFDERFPRAFREDADLALRALDAGWKLGVGRRRTTHPVRPADRWVSVRTQAGNADDVLMNRLHGRDWWGRAGAPRGRLPRHAAVTAAGAAALVCVLARRPRAAALPAALWLAGTAEFAAARIRPGPRTREETVTMALTSALIPPVATGHWLRGLLRHRRAGPGPVGSPPPAPDAARPERPEDRLADPV
ncbi:MULTISPECIES: glycosyltransferase family 2 protein [Streptomyces]|uniref:Glycosyltransferase family 2 protein n=1 Tax=Streptomyces lycii TaxID=2654337 RepID=A0ABQ7FL17_9ACTN|nr:MULTISPECIES: glycosyltransferase family 2 protein [Streptomyces]KAF4409375.1 glycosyltransferase family 2 protein [Streptomyces lycii]PGH47935.1 transferase [Streptomyces sp. Ru87]